MLVWFAMSVVVEAGTHIIKTGGRRSRSISDHPRLRHASKAREERPQARKLPLLLRVGGCVGRFLLPVPSLDSIRFDRGGGVSVNMGLHAIDRDLAKGAKAS